MNHYKSLFILSIIILSLGSRIHAQGSVKSALEPELPVWYLQTADQQVKLFVQEYGKGDTVIIVHGGFGAEHSYLLDAFKGFEKKYHLVFYDQRGSLRSPAADSLISIDKHIEDLELLRKELNLSKMNLVGHSMGTFLCGYYLQKYPGRVKTMTLLALVYPKTAQTEPEKLESDNQQREAVKFFERPEVHNELVQEGLDKTVLSSKEATDKWRITFAGVNIYHISRWRQVKGGQVFYNQAAGSAAGKTLPNEGWDFIQLYRESNIPVTVINGSHDFADMGGKLYKPWLHNIPNLEYILIENAGHNAWIDSPDTFKQSLKKALRKSHI